MWSDPGISRNNRGEKFFMTHFSHRTLSPQNPVFPATNAQVPVSLLTSLPSHVQAEMLQGMHLPFSHCHAPSHPSSCLDCAYWLWAPYFFFTFGFQHRSQSCQIGIRVRSYPSSALKPQGHLHLKYKLTTLQPPQAALSAPFQPSLPTCFLFQIH